MIQRVTRPAAGYIRMSTDKQEESPERQKREILSLAEREGYRVVEWFEDHGLTGTESANRPEFQRLLQTIPKRRFDAVLMYEQSRMSREHVFDVFPTWKVLMESGVDVVTCQRGRISFDDLGGMLSAIVEQHGAHEESIKIAKRSVSGRKLKLTKGNHWGVAVFGYDREIRDESGSVVKRVHFQERFTKPRNWTSRLVPSADVDAVDAIRDGYRAIRDGKTIADVCRDFNRRGLMTTYNKKFNSLAVKRLMLNPIYTGTLVGGKRKEGKFARLGDDGIIVVENAHEPLVSKELFETVHRILSGRLYSRSPNKGYLLSGLLVCARCQRPMYGKTQHYPSGPVESYTCRSDERNTDANCDHPHIASSHIEPFLLKAIRERFSSDPELANRIEAAVNRLHSEKSAISSIEETQLEEVRAKIEQASENLALANGRSFDAVNRVLQKWLARQEELEQRIADRRGDVASTPKSKMIAKNLPLLLKNIESADRGMLRIALHETIDAVTIGRRILSTTGDRRQFQWHGRVVFRPAFGAAPIEITTEAYVPKESWQRICNYIVEADRPVRVKELAKRFERSQATISRHLIRGVEEGVIRRLGHREAGYVAADSEVKTKAVSRWKEVAGYIRQAGRAVRHAELQKALGIDRTVLSRAIQQAVQQGTIERAGNRKQGFLPVVDQAIEPEHVILKARRQRVCSDCPRRIRAGERFVEVREESKRIRVCRRCQFARWKHSISAPPGSLQKRLSEAETALPNVNAVPDTFKIESSLGLIF